ncbi:MAG: hypothetical protein LC753_00085, partial [Acidobacteria bacterium]|nr:hypothetical protein [Acidobacteriota bacterium]
MLPWLCLALAAYAAMIAATGGYEFHFAGIRLRSHSWVRPAAVAGFVAIVWAIRARTRVLWAASRAWAVLESLT